MADFEPTTTIYFFERTCVDPQNQPFFSSEAEKIAWYMSHNVMQFSEYSYQRENRQYVRVREKASVMRKYDMMSFRNDPADRWIICRVIEVEFVNPNTTQITFETDSLQTFIDVCTFKDSWVEREMVKDDWNGSLPSYNNLMPEGIETGKLKDKYILDTDLEIDLPGYDAVVLSAYDATAEINYSIKTYSGYLSGLNTIVCSTAYDLSSLLTVYAEKGRLDGISGIWIVPKNCIDSFHHEYTVSHPSDIDGYVPKNAKCFSSEFCRFVITNRQGNNAEYEPELLFKINPGQASFNCTGDFAAASGELVMGPWRYGTTDDHPLATWPDYCVHLPLNVQTCFVGNAFANWVSQNRGGLMIEGIRDLAGILSSAGSIIGGVATGNPLLLASGINQVPTALYSSLNTMSSIAKQASSPAGVLGSNSGPGSAISQSYFGFVVYYRTPMYDCIKSIDDFFTVYGYRTCKAKKPNINTRPFWNYVKCSPAVVEGPFTSKDRSNIEASLSAGVTFWHVTKGAVIGDYSMDNRG